MKRVVMVTAALALLASGLAFQRSLASALSVTDLGKTTNVVPNYGLGNFHYIKTSLRNGLKPELLFIGEQLTDEIEAERWPVIKALDQFGTFSAVTPWPNMSHNPDRRTFPSFNLRHVVYRSRYVAFVNKDLFDIYGKPLQRLSAQESRLFDRYSSLDQPGSLRAGGGGLPSSCKCLPLVAVGGYAQTFPTDPVFAATFAVPAAGPQPTACLSAGTCGANGYRENVATFSDVQQTLLTGKPKGGLTADLLYQINAETNVIITLICHADHNQPKSVCGRAVIRRLMKHVK